MEPSARIVPGAPHHVTQRGNKRQPIFIEKGDYALYRDLLAERCAANGVACWAYCLMPNHVRLILTPTTEAGLSRSVGEAHRRYTAFFNACARVTGHLFQGRFSSAAIDEHNLLVAFRYLALNPVRAGLVARAEDWRRRSLASSISATRSTTMPARRGKSGCSTKAIPLAGGLATRLFLMKWRRGWAIRFV